MEKKLIEVFDKNCVEYHFVEFDDGMDFIRITRIIKDKISPDQLDYQGIEDMHGFFEKDSLHIDLEYDGMIGNWMEFKGEQSDKNLRKVREWANTIFDNLMGYRVN